jgi:phosphotransacetylase
MNKTSDGCTGYDQILARAQDRFSASRKPRAAMVAHASPLTLQAFERAYNAELIEPVVVGDQALFEREIASQAPGLSSIEIIDEDHPLDAVRIVADMVRAGDVDLVVHGGILSASLIGELFHGESRLIHPGETVSHVAVIESPRYRKALLLTDGALHDRPDFSVRLGIIQNLIGFAQRVGIAVPRIGILAAVEVVYPQMPVTMEAAAMAKMAERGQIKGVFIDGPLSVDTALDPLAAQAKGILKSDVAGDADAFLAPDAATAHGMYEAMQFWGDCRIGGVVLGARVPFALSFPSDTVNTRFHSILLAVAASL